MLLLTEEIQRKLTIVLPIHHLYNKKNKIIKYICKELMEN